MQFLRTFRAKQLEATPRGRDSPEQHADGGRLPRSVGAEESEHLALLDLERHLIDGQGFSIALGEIRSLDDGQGGLPG